MTISFLYGNFNIEYGDGKMKKSKKRYCISCGCVLTPIEERICFGCALLAILGGEKPEVQEAQKEVWQRVLSY